MSIRTDRVSAVLQRDLGEIIQKSYQPAGCFITVTHVDISPDLMNTNVYISVLAPGKDENAIFEHLTQHGVEIRKKLAAKIRNQFRRVPELYFKNDSSSQYAQKMDKLFSDIDGKRDSNTSGSK